MTYFRTARLALIFALMLIPIAALAHEYQAGDLHIAHPSSVATPPRAPNGVAYLTIHHGGEKADRLISASTPRADRVQLHQSREADGMAAMEKVDLPLTIAPGTELKLAPGGRHFMLMGIHAPLKVGERIPLTLVFESAGEVEVELAVEALGGTAAKDQKGSANPSGHHGH